MRQGKIAERPAHVRPVKALRRQPVRTTYHETVVGTGHLPRLQLARQMRGGDAFSLHIQRYHLVTGRYSLENLFALALCTPGDIEQAARIAMELYDIEGKAIPLPGEGMLLSLFDSW